MKQSHLRLQNTTAVILIIAASAWMSASCVNIIKYPFNSAIIRKTSFEEPDIYNFRLNQLQMNLSTIDEYLPPRVPLRYIALSNEFDELQRTQAILAPRRVGPDVKSLYVLVCASPEELSKILPSLGNVRLIVRLLDDVAIFKKEPLH